MDIGIIELIEKKLENTPVHLKYYSTLESTNILASQFAKEGVSEWTVVGAREQLKGKGRYQRQWISPPGMGLLLSIILRPDILLKQIQLINLFTALTIGNFIELKLKEKWLAKNQKVQLKWPNDILINGQKICGILLESNIKNRKLDFIVVGIGLNVNQSSQDFAPEIREIATSLKIITGKEFDLHNLISEFLIYYYHRFVEMVKRGFHSVVQPYQEKLIFRDEPVEIKLQDGLKRGINRGIDDQGYLVLQTSEGIEKITVGDVWGIDSKEET